MSFWACDRKLDFAQFRGCIDMNGILSVHMYVFGLPRPAHPSKVKYSLFTGLQAKAIELI